MHRGRSLAWPAATAGLWVAALGAAALTWHHAVHSTGAGLDFLTYWQAARALEHGGSIYANPAFVYLPTAALVFVPLTALGAHTAVEIWIALEVVALALACVAATWPLDRRHRGAAAGLALLLVSVSAVLYAVAWLGNVSLMLAPVGVLTLLCFDRGAWRWGCAILALSLLLKPLLVPLVLIPLLTRHWRELALPLGLAAIAVAVAAVALPGGEHLLHSPGFVFGGGDSKQPGNLLYNTSLAAVGRRVGATGAFLVARVLVVTIVLAALAAWRRAGARTGATAAAGALVLLATMLAGTLSENHYLLVAVLCVLVAVTRARRLGPALAGIPALVVIVVPSRLVGHLGSSPAGLQVRCLAATLLLLAPPLWLALTGWLASQARHPQLATSYS
jgi:hypothetical protein